MTKGVILMEELPGLAAPFFTLSEKVLYRTLHKIVLYSTISMMIIFAPEAIWNPEQAS